MAMCRQIEWSRRARALSWRVGRIENRLGLSINHHRRESPPRPPAFFRVRRCSAKLTNADAHERHEVSSRAAAVVRFVRSFCSFCSFVHFVRSLVPARAAVRDILCCAAGGRRVVWGVGRVDVASCDRISRRPRARGAPPVGQGRQAPLRRTLRADRRGRGKGTPASETRHVSDFK